MLENLSSRLSRILKTMRGQARLTEENTRTMLREVRLALLDADVALPVVRELIARIKAKAMGEEVVANLNPGQALVGVVERELTQVIGGDLPPEERRINLAVQPPAVILLAGLQGAGKTTTAGKLAKWLIETSKKKVLTVSADVYRPAAIEQLKTVSAQAAADFFPSETGQKPLDIARNALDHARRHFYDVLIVDTAGRLAIDEAMMQEVSDLAEFLKPAETLFVIDAMLGQDAVNTARAFNERLNLTGVILTKLDGDSRGGAALHKNRRPPSAGGQTPAAYLHIKAEQNHIAVLHHVFLALAADQPLFLGRLQRTALDQRIVGNDLRPDEPALEVTVDLPGSLRRLGAFGDGPGAHLRLAGSQEADQPQQVIAGSHQPVQP